MCRSSARFRYGSFFVEIRDLFCFKQAEKVLKIPVYRLFTPGCERS
ncbi:hypothetical protein PARMER_03127 [Parabacteroides merdae ATCC 43184]|nr:hypothetical protein PARMER_03127 [Parabacteroides merdae ATCC 43184]